MTVIDTGPVLAALWMGLVGGAHCTLMCGGLCATVSSAAGVKRQRRAAAAWHLGRLAGYACAGAAVAAVSVGMQSAAGFAPWLKPLWTLAHLVVLAWGLSLLVAARQPVWVREAGRFLWRYAKPVPGRLGAGVGMWVSVVGLGFAWVLLPCGLLYSALVMAAYSPGPAHGALTMLAFAAGSAVWLLAASSTIARLQQRSRLWRDGVGVRLAGVLLIATAALAMAMNASPNLAAYCGV